jgi:hypothetical protein
VHAYWADKLSQKFEDFNIVTVKVKNSEEVKSIYLPV